MDIVLVVFRIVGILRLVADVRFVVRHVVQVAAGFGYGVADVDVGVEHACAVLALRVQSVLMSGQVS